VRESVRECVREFVWLAVWFSPTFRNLRVEQMQKRIKCTGFPNIEI
jgi:hypothetical protein